MSIINIKSEIIKASVGCPGRKFTHGGSKILFADQGKCATIVDINTIIAIGTIDERGCVCIP